MFWSSKALPWIIPSILISIETNGVGIVVSPWIENIKLQLFYVQGTQNISGEQTLIQFLIWLNHERGTRFKFYVREDQLAPRVNYRLRDIINGTRTFSEYYMVPNLHAKFIATDHSVLETSANLLTRSLYTNPETLSVRANHLESSVGYVNDFFSRAGVRPRLWLDN
jgi:hypothetical protein